MSSPDPDAASSDRRIDRTAVAEWLTILAGILAVAGVCISAYKYLHPTPLVAVATTLAIGIATAVVMLTRKVRRQTVVITDLRDEIAEEREQSDRKAEAFRDEIEELREKAEADEAALRDQLESERVAAAEERSQLDGRIEALTNQMTGYLAEGPLVNTHHFQDKMQRSALVHNMLGDAQKTIRVVGVVNEMVTHDLDEDYLKGFFALGGHMQILFIDPNGTAVTEREHLERTQQHRIIPDGDFARRTRSSIQCLAVYLEEIKLETASRHGGRGPGVRQVGKLEIKVYNREPTLGLLLVDDSRALFHYYGLSTMGVFTPSYEVDSQSGDGRVKGELLANYYKGEFDSLWNMETSTVWAGND
jgi:hypothetical protein